MESAPADIDSPEEEDEQAGNTGDSSSKSGSSSSGSESSSSGTGKVTVKGDLGAREYKVKFFVDKKTGLKVKMIMS